MTNRRNPSIRLYLPADMLADLRRTSAATGHPVQVLIRDAIERARSPPLNLPLELDNL